jgi:putative ABC transport system ATP-binding protein
MDARVPTVERPTAISLRQVRHRYLAAVEGAPRPFELKVPALSVGRGERVAVVGPSGAGKTTLIELLAGLQVPTAGQVVVDGVELSSTPDAARRAFRSTRLGLVFQDLQLLDYLSVFDNVLLPYRVHPTLELGAAARLRARQLLDEAGLASVSGRRVGTLSRGERQRVAVCRALVTRPAVVLADEPTAHLDARDTGRVLDLLFHRLQAEHTLVMVTHDSGLLHRFQRTLELEAP